MSIAYSLVPRDMLRGLIAPPPRNLDEAIIHQSTRNMQKVLRKRRRRRNLTADRQKYMSNLRNLIKTKRELENRPKLVQIQKPPKENRPEVKVEKVQTGRKRIVKVPTMKLPEAPRRQRLETKNLFMGADEPDDEPVFIEEPAKEPSTKKKKTDSTSTAIEPEPPIAVDKVAAIKVDEATAPKSTKKTTRSRSTVDNELNILDAMIDDVKDLIRATPNTYGVRGEKIWNSQRNSPMAASNWERSVPFIVADVLSLPQPDAGKPSGTPTLKTNLEKSLAFNQIVEKYKKLLAKEQQGKGKTKQQVRRGQKQPKALKAQKIPGKRGRPKGGIVVQQETPFRVERWRLPNR